MKLNTIRHIALITLAIAGSASANTYVKLSAADNTVYATTTGQRVNVSIAETATAGWNKYSEFLGGGERLVYTKNGTESVYIYNDAAGVSEKLINFADPVGSKYAFQLGYCTNGGAIEKKGLTMSTAAGTFKNVVRMSFTNNCADGGTIDAYFAPKVGVIKWSTQSIIGPVSFELANGVIRGKTFGAAEPQNPIKVSTSFPQNHIVLSATVKQADATLDVTNTSTKDLVVHFGSGQEFELSLLDADANVINTWGAKVRFLVGPHDVTIAAGKTISFGGAVALEYANGQSLNAGQYGLRIELLATPATQDGTLLPSAIRAESSLSVSRN
jgi:hypothetical protein